ncbi:MAG: MBL fold metallo-hydrolase [Candidatus Tectomicrobia bacterium]|nr:MBL fold metallo-hydrolase [Candidatus Tectomicrobia bacterium]
MRVRFWGTRGSIAKPGPTTLRYGGNTPCIEVETADGTLFILDSGTGIHGLGQELVTSRKPPVKGHLLISHYHWDHIQGFPFFTPLFIPGNDWHVYGPGGMDQQVKTILAGQMTYSYFPISLEEFGAGVHYHNLGEGSFDIEDARITTQYTNHPALTLAFRIEAGGATFVYIPDHEPNSLFSLDGKPGSLPLHLQDRRHVEFLVPREGELGALALRKDRRIRPRGRGQAARALPSRPPAHRRGRRALRPGGEGEREEGPPQARRHRRGGRARYRDPGGRPAPARRRPALRLGLALR